jgi:hypothetical protein
LNSSVKLLRALVLVPMTDIISPIEIVSIRSDQAQS